MITDRRLRIYAFNGGCVEEAAWGDIVTRLALWADFHKHMHISVSLVVEVFNTLGRLEQPEETK